MTGLSPEAVLHQRKLLSAARATLRRKVNLCFDPEYPDSRPSPTQQKIIEDNLHRTIIVRAPNQVGKSSLGARIISWWFQDNHPFMQRPERWGTGPLTLVVVGNNLTIVEQELWAKKIALYLDEADYVLHKSGSAISWAENVKNKNRIIFMSHHGGAEQVREKLQGMRANVVWLDEMPSSSAILSELLARTLTTDGFLYATFTPLVRNDEIRKMCDQGSEGWITYTPLADEIPIHAKDIEAYDRKVRAMSATEEEYRARRFGEWWYGAGRVIRAYRAAENRRPLPALYSPEWRHVLWVDPAASGLAGISLMAEDPSTHKWWVVKASYLEGDAPSVQVKAAEQFALGYRVIGRFCDHNPAGFYKEAKLQGIVYKPFHGKNNRKQATIDILNEKFLEGKIVVAATPATDGAHEELLSCSWSETVQGKIVNETSYHILDTIRYFADNIPSPVVEETQYASYYHMIKAMAEAEEQQRLNPPPPPKHKFMKSRAVVRSKSTNYWR